MNSPLLQKLRTLAIRRWVLICFMLAVGVATAAPILQPQSIQLLCSGNGVMKLLISSHLDDVSEDTKQSSHTLQCAMCLPTLAPLPNQVAHIDPPCDLAYATQSIPKAILAWLTAPPMPARGPPTEYALIQKQ